MNITESVRDVINPRGIVTYTALYGSGRREILGPGLNTVLNGSSQFMRDLLAGGVDTVTKCVYGDRNLSFLDNLSLEPSPALVTDTALLHYTFFKPVKDIIVGTSQDGRPSVTYVFEIPQSDNLGSPDGKVIISEIGLCRSDDLMFSKKNHAPVLKTPLYGLLLSWEITF